MTITSTASARLLVGVAAVTLALAGCSSASSSTTPTTAPSPGAVSSPGVIGPVILTPQSPDGDVELGRTVVFDLGADPAAWDLVTSDPAMLALTPGGTRDGATFNWGAQTLKTGKASVVATPKGSGTPVTFIVTVTG